MEPYKSISLKKLHDNLSMVLYKETKDIKENSDSFFASTPTSLSNEALNKNKFTPSINEYRAITSLLLQEYLSVSMADILVGLQVILSQENTIKIRSALERIKNHEPIQYILGKAHFFGEEYIVNKNTLIPRPETEELIKIIIDDFIKKRNHYEKDLNILDIGTGTGCIAIALYKEISKYHKDVKVDAIDICKDALQVAKANARNLKADIQFHNIDILNEGLSHKHWDIIVSNPPYVRYSEKSNMAPNVLLYEPSKALFVSDLDPLIFYNSIIVFCTKKLNPSGIVYLEVNEHLANEVAGIFTHVSQDLLNKHYNNSNKKSFGNTIIKKDINDKNRFVIAKI